MQLRSPKQLFAVGTFTLMFALSSMGCDKKPDAATPTKASKTPAANADKAAPSAKTPEAKPAAKAEPKAAAPTPKAPATKAALKAEPKAAAPAAKAPEAKPPVQDTPKAAFARRLWKAFAAKDAAAYTKARATKAAVAAICPEGTGKVEGFMGTRYKDALDLSKALGACQEFLSGATFAGFRGGEVYKPTDGCAKLQRSSNMRVLADKGDKRILLNVREVLQSGDVLLLHRDPRCEIVDKAADIALAAKIVTAKAEICACKDRACAQGVMLKGPQGFELMDAARACMDRLK